MTRKALPVLYVILPLPRLASNSLLVVSVATFVRASMREWVRELRLAAVLEYLCAEVVELAGDW